MACHIWLLREVGYPQQKTCSHDVASIIIPLSACMVHICSAFCCTYIKICCRRKKEVVSVYSWLWMAGLPPSAHPLSDSFQKLSMTESQVFSYNWGRLGIKSGISLVPFSHCTGWWWLKGKAGAALIPYGASVSLFFLRIYTFISLSRLYQQEKYSWCILPIGQL